MTETTTKPNERSEGSLLISQMNLLFADHDWNFKSAVGELSVVTQNSRDLRNGTLFPDVILFKDKSNLLPIMGWEFKMPDTPIDNKEFESNARDKADRLGTSAFVLWNFQYCRVFYRNSDGSWPIIPSRSYKDYESVLVSRSAVNSNSILWHQKLEQVLTDLNSDIMKDRYRVAPIEFNIGNYVDTISRVLTPLTQEYLLTLKKPILRSKMREFVRKEQSELIEVETGKKLTDEYAALAFSKNMIIRWINRILFSSIIKNEHNNLAHILREFIRVPNVKKFSRDVNTEIEETDFYSVLHVDTDEQLLPQTVVDNLAEFANYMWQTDLSQVNGDFVSKVLESVIQVTKRELMGLYTTPPNLAQLLVLLTITNPKGNFADFTVGSGTIVNAIITALREYNSIEKIHNQVWAADKYEYPLQIANLNMTSSDSLNQKNIIFQMNALEQAPGKQVNIVDPESGEEVYLKVPRMSALISNLPFVSSNNRSKDDKELLKPILKNNGMSLKTDLYQGLILHYKELMEKSKDSRIGVITSNSWFKNLQSSSFFEVLLDNFDIEYVLYSDVARWFDNAKVVASILVLAPKGANQDKIQFVSLQTDIRSLKSEEIKQLVDEIRVNSKSKMALINKYSGEESKRLLDTGVCVEALFDDLSWFKRIIEKSVLRPLTDFCLVNRGTRTGGDQIFITKGLQTNKSDSRPYVKTIKEITKWHATSSGDFFFYTKDTLSELAKKGHQKTIDYIQSVSGTQRAATQRQKHGELWYVAEEKPKYADFITSINPDKRWFWSAFDEPTALNQRFVAATVKTEYKNDRKLIHALLNSVIPLFILCGSGFARADGVTDLTSQGMSRLSILNYELLNKIDKQSIMNEWIKVENKRIVPVLEQLTDPDWISFNKVVLKSFGIDTQVLTQATMAISKLINRRNAIRLS